jgi:flagellar basal-body rod protein FlgG
MQSVYTAKHGLQAQQQRLDVIASNIANVGTTGYKNQTAAFKDALYTHMIDPSDTASAANLQQGSGVLFASAYHDFSEGTPVQTGETLDLYIEGDGFFTVQDDRGGVLYTRSGALSVSAEEDGEYLTTANGLYVLDENGNRIALPEDMGDLSVSQDGIMDFGNGTSAKLGIVTFINKDGLSQAGGGCYAATAASGDARKSSATVKQGYLETSNVDISLELTRLIRTQRAYSLADRVLTTWDEMESETNNIR